MTDELDGGDVEAIGDFRDMCYADNRRCDELERQIKDIWRRIHSICEMNEDRDQH